MRYRRRSSSTSDRRSSTVSVFSCTDSLIPTRQRTMQACDQCRRRKTKCCGNLPCSACTNAGLDCSFGHKEKQTRGPAYVTYLERTVKHLEDQVTQMSTPPDSQCTSEPGMTESQQPPPAVLETLTCPLRTSHLYQRSNRCLYGSCSGLEVLRHMRLRLDDAAGLPRRSPCADLLIETLDRPLPTPLTYPKSSAGIFSPKMEALLSHINTAFNKAYWVCGFLDRSELEAVLHRFYRSETSSPNFHAEQDEIALIYAVAAIGEYFDPGSPLPSEEINQIGDPKGVAFFRTARSFVDLTQCGRSLPALQTVVCLTVYLVAISAMSTAYAFLNAAVGAAMSVGLHLPAHRLLLSKSENMKRKDTYQILQALDIYVTVSLGLPCCLPPLDGIPMDESRNLDSWPGVPLSQELETASYTYLAPLLPVRDFVRSAYFSGQNPCATGFYLVSCTLVHRYNDYSDAWHKLACCNMEEKATSPRLAKTMFKRLTGSYMQLIANAPFLHYVTNCTTFGHADGYAAGAKCVTASIDTIETLQFLQDRSLLDGSHSVVVCSLVYAATALLQIELADARIPCLDRVKEAILAAQSLFFALGCQHSIVSKCYQSLQPIYQIVQERAIRRLNPTNGAMLCASNGWVSGAPEENLDMPDPVLLTGSVDRPAETLHLDMFPELQ